MEIDHEIIFAAIFLPSRRVNVQGKLLRSLDVTPGAWPIFNKYLEKSGDSLQAKYVPQLPGSFANIFFLKEKSKLRGIIETGLLVPNHLRSIHWQQQSGKPSTIQELKQPLQPLGVHWILSRKSSSSCSICCVFLVYSDQIIA